MTRLETLKQSLASKGAVAALAYVAAVIALAGASWLALAGLAESYAHYRGAQERLAAIERRGAQDAAAKDEAQGTPFLEGPTVTVAGADLQRRVAAAVAAAGGLVLSSQLDLQGPEAADGFVALSTNCEVAQAALQTLLYDLEAGAPLLFIEQIVVQSPQGSGETEGKRMRVQIDVAGQWRAAR